MTDIFDDDVLGNELENMLNGCLDVSCPNCGVRYTVHGAGLFTCQNCGWPIEIEPFL